MLRKRKTAVVRQRNLLGKLVRGRMSIAEVVGLTKDAMLNRLDSGLLLPVIGGGTTATNTVLANPVYFPRALVSTTDQTIKQGDLVYWDPVNYTLKPLTAATQVANAYCGAAQGNNIPNVYPDVPSGVPSEKASGVVVQRGGTVKVGTNTGEGTYFPFEPVTIGTDSQTVSRGGQTSANRVGFIILPPPVLPRGAAGATPVPETAASGSSVELWLEPKFPDTALL